MTALEALNVVRPLPLRVDDFLLLNDSGAFVDYGKAELIDGGIVYMNAQHRPHARIKRHLARELEHALTGTVWEVLTEVTISMPPHNAPEPDIVLTSEPEGEGPVPLASIALVVEVADTTLRNDLDIKQRIYANGKIPEYWVADVEGRVIHQMWSPGDDGYADQRIVSFGEGIAAQTIADLRVETAALR